MEEQRFDWLERSAAWVMRLARWHPALVLPLPIGLGVLIAVSLRLYHHPAGLVSGILACGLVAWLYGMLTTMRAILYSLETALEERDEQRIFFLRQLIEGEPVTPSDFALKHIGDAELWMRLGQPDRAAEAYDQIDHDAVTPLRRPGLRGGHALAVALAGEPGRGLLLIDAACAEADALRRYPAAKRRLLALRRGVVLSLAGRHEEALAVLTPFANDEDDSTTKDLVESAIARSRSAFSTGSARA